MSHRARLLGVLVPLFTLPGVLVRAEPPRPTPTWSEEASEGVAEPRESPELRALRLAEHELFDASDERPPEVYDPDCVLGVPDALSSDAPPASLERAGGEVEDLSFLSGLALPSLPVRWDARVIDYLLFFKNDRRGRELAGAWLRRLDRYGPMLRRVLREHSLPEDLEIVAMVESGYDPLARSQVGALGLWQFVKPSAEFYGLRMDHWIDERMDPERSTRAAARYLRDLFDRFGTWDLTFAAYNMGYGRLVTAIRKYNSNDYWLLSHLEAGMPFETSIYVAKITAMAIVARNPDRFGFAELTREPTLVTTSVDVPAGTPLRAVASAAGIDPELMKTLNPHLKRGKVPPGDVTAAVYIPRDSYDKFAERWSKNHEPAQLTSYVVRFGETLEDVARRFKISPAQLREVNELASTAEVRAGVPLLVPATGEVKTQNGEQQVATVPDKNFRYEDRRRIFYRVAARDTPEAVARFFEVTVDELLSWNHISESGILQRDMLLQLFVRKDLDVGRAVVLTPDEVRVLTVGSDEFFDFHEGQRGRVRVRYRVQPNDTLAKLAERFELSVGSLGRINQFASTKELAADDTIIVYVPEKQVPELERRGIITRLGAGAPAAKVEPPKTPEEEHALPPEIGDDQDTLTPPAPDEPVSPPLPAEDAPESAP